MLRAIAHLLAISMAITLIASTPGQPARADASSDVESVLAPLARHSLLLDGARAGDRLVVVGERGHILVSDDSGGTWRQIVAPTRVTLAGVCFPDDRSGWAVGHDAVILRTRDAGESWVRVHHAPEQERPLLDVWFADAERGFAVGAYGYLLQTVDGGESWVARPIGEGFGDGLGDDFHLNRISRAAGGRLFIAAEAGTIYRSDDDGESWASLVSPYEGSFFGTLPLADDTLLLFGLRGHLYSSEDAGENWASVESSTEAMLTDGLLLEDGRIVIVGLGGTLLTSTDGGRSFAHRQQPDRQGFSAVLQAPDGTLILVGEFGVTRFGGE